MSKRIIGLDSGNRWSMMGLANDDLRMEGVMRQPHH
jgi:hypothetical protein